MFWADIWKIIFKNKVYNIYIFIFYFLFCSLRKHAYSNILKILQLKKENYQIKNSDIFHISAQNIDCGYSLEPPRRGGSNEYPQSMFLSRNKKNNVYPCKPQFYYIKVGFKGVKIIWACFRDVEKCVLSRAMAKKSTFLSLSVLTQQTTNGCFVSIFPENRIWHWRQLAWNIKSCFLGKKIQKNIFENVFCWKIYPEC